jgi:hypothetical protein
VQRAAAQADAPVDVLERVGLAGDDPADDVRAALDALRSGDDTAARSAAQRALDTYDDASSSGVRRAAVAAAALVLVAMLGGAMIRRSRSVRPPTPDPSR